MQMCNNKKKTKLFFFSIVSNERRGKKQNRPMVNHTCQTNIDSDIMKQQIIKQTKILLYSHTYTKRKEKLFWKEIKRNAQQLTEKKKSLKSYASDKMI